jgi:ATP-dependent helicase/nuclease subunit B
MTAIDAASIPDPFVPGEPAGHAAVRTRGLPLSLGPQALWAAVADEVASFLCTTNAEVRDALVLLPTLAHVPLARQAWATAHPAAWMPRFETLQTLGAALAPAAPTPQSLQFDPIGDRLQAEHWLRESAGTWPSRDPQGFAVAVARVVEAAQALARARLALRPSARDAWLDAARQALALPPGPAAEERSLAKLALAWSQTADARAIEALHALPASARIVVQLAPDDRLGDEVLRGASTPGLRLDASAAEPALSLALLRRVTILACADAEEEAQASAARVLDHVAAGEVPVALLAVDRALVRRVRALLERQGVPLRDETGWKLSTTRAGATVVGLLRALAPQASGDALLDWLASTPHRLPGFDAFEAEWRQHGWRRASALPTARFGAKADRLARRWAAAVALLQGTRRADLRRWLALLRDALRALDAWAPLEGDEAGAQVIAALRLTDAAAEATWPATEFGLAGFTAWVDSVMEQVAFEPAVPLDAPVVITPLSRAAGRPFAAAVLPGADHAHLGAAAPAPALLGEALAALLGAPTAASQRDQQWQALLQLLRLPRLSLLWRRSEGAEPLAPSAFVLRLREAARLAGGALDEAAATLPRRTLALQPVARPLPRAPDLLPTSWHATAYEALRACPYRFHAQRVLGLREADELGDELERRDVGTWLHEVLKRFHEGRDAAAVAGPHDTGGDARLLHRLALEVQHEQGIDADEFLPYAAWFDGFVPHYLGWLQVEEAQGWTVRRNEWSLQAEQDGLRVRGQLDRVDARAAQGASGRESVRIVDYKLGTASRWKQAVREPLEDTQLAFYAALWDAAQAGAPTEPTSAAIEAAYLALDDRSGVVLVPHPDVTSSAEALRAGLRSDVERLRAGAAMQALGEGPSCEHCAARGLCRRDHWEDAP